jgi:hypothetical protein
VNPLIGEQSLFFRSFAWDSSFVKFRSFAAISINFVGRADLFLFSNFLFIFHVDN